MNAPDHTDLPDVSDAVDRECMTRAIAAAAGVRCATSPNPWVGAVVRAADGRMFQGATEPPGGAHAEVVALREAGEAARGASLYCTLEPCSHTGRTGPCTEAIIEAGIRRVVVGVVDPDPNVSGRGIEQLRAAGVDVLVGVQAEKVAGQLVAYLKHRSTGRPYVVLKLAATLDGGTAAPNGTSQWITSPEARADGHRLRAESDAILVGAGTVRRDDPSLTVRDYRPPVLPDGGNVDPLRVVLGTVAEDARVQPCYSTSGALGDVLDDLGSKGVLQLLVEGGANVAGEFHRAGLVDRYVIYTAPALFGGDDAKGLFGGNGAWDISEVRRGRFVAVERVGVDLRIEMVPDPADGGAADDEGHERRGR
ncbi:bifunctional diaminohydroxyphosphoribosylaminopyrimidine deaminase/5-amino-6-(5-phosphoribosylamino)uracil reductase RibD [Dermatobacter hominis]|uniref:bifunctional diaminohydroxyphosphoribosylaminopyrimidine deaminase/5-amino-6-(5-phosphoribosylamino)uracil reductase RibD n=1 Tax=Dermatobacter hominis TaxID=2884263 RepID=UPI001D128D9B|nr:bifunctional diaminohydroxyphosphoribosylaminopyrimidine deaminase/5-amino-6-(5-phosphoribosylamino)uracil reductase RibD [Dermatobacter hominis]UDY36209.1 bifunctional diaminohydroxyphosphoribosylaminopyrimidine deaminase/5-amino-6-(5-phosphoribosylamino)uracil reductase RibD [Dermatobacter hominis]